VVKKRASGAQRRIWRAIKSAADKVFGPGLVRSGKVGRPRGSRRGGDRLAQLRRDLIWIGEPNTSNSELAMRLLKKKEFCAAYHGISARTLRRDIGIIQKELWPHSASRRKRDSL
jgi:hypothetical protein